MRAYERLLRYAAVNTTSFREGEGTPTGKGQFDLAYLLEKEMKEMGLEDVSVDEHAYVYGFLPATPGYEHCRSIGFISHLDTVNDCGGTDTHPQVIEGYDGSPIPLGESGRVLNPEVFPHLKECRGKTIPDHRRDFCPGGRRQGGHFRDHDHVRDPDPGKDSPRQDLRQLYPGRGDRPRGGSFWIWINSERTLHIPWTAPFPEKWSTRLSMRQRPALRSGASAYIPVRPRGG